MKHKLSIIYSWFIRSLTFFLPDVPLFMRFRGFLYSLFMKRCGKNLQVTSTVIFNSLQGLSFGQHIYIAHNTVVIGTDISIGDEVIIGPNCLISGGNHVFENGSYRFARSVAAPVNIGAGCWIGGNCSILAGTSLPEQAVLAAGSVLDRPAEEKRAMYAGVPAKLIKKL